MEKSSWDRGFRHGRARARKIVLALGALCFSCSSMNNGVVSLQATALGAIRPAEYDSPSEGGRGLGGAVDHVGLGVGLGAALNSSVIDIVGRLEERDLGANRGSTLAIGLRKRFPNKGAWTWYLQALHRVGDRVDVVNGQSASSGFASGFGVIVPVSASGWFIDISIGVESSYERLNGMHDGPRLEGLYLNIGLGWAIGG